MVGPARKDITHLAFDTSILIGSGWPHLSTGLQNVLNAAGELKVRVLLPELVLSEAETIWFESTSSGLNKIQVEAGRQSRTLRGLCDTPLAVPPSKAALLAYYEKTVGQILAAPRDSHGTVLETVWTPLSVQ